MKFLNTLYIVVPCYNEQETIEYSAKRLLEKVEDLVSHSRVSTDSRILFVNDGSTDQTWDLIKRLHKSSVAFCGLDLSCNKGQQNALMAGLMYAKEYADVVVTLDADLQDDIDVIDKMLDKFDEGCDVVYGVRSSRRKDSFFKRVTAEAFYRFMNFLGAKTIFNHADFRLMSRRAVNALEQFEEVNLFLRGIVPLIGYNTAIVEYERKRRKAGETKYPLRKMVSFALDGITSFSIRPLRIITLLGVVILFVSLIMLVYALVSFFTDAVKGWSSILISIWGIGGLTLFSIGVVGEYVGKTYLESKHRPKYFVKEIIDEKKKSQ